MGLAVPMNLRRDPGIQWILSMEHHGTNKQRFKYDNDELLLYITKGSGQPLKIHMLENPGACMIILVPVYHIYCIIQTNKERDCQPGLGPATGVMRYRPLSLAAGARA